MHYLGEYPQSWGLNIQRNVDGGVSRVFNSRTEAEEDGNFEEVKNFVFWSGLVYSGTERRPGNVLYWFFMDDQSRALYRFTGAGMDMLLKEIASGQIQVVDGKMQGLWTFRNWAGYISCSPLSKEEEMRLGISM